MLVPLTNATFMRRITPRPAAMTTRKLAASLALGVLLVLAGCSTPGPLHVYTLGTGASDVFSVAASSIETVHDTGPEGTADVPSFITAKENLAGFAYDPF